MFSYTCKHFLLKKQSSFVFSFLRHDVVVSRSPINLNPTLHNMTDNRLMKMSVFVYAADVSLQECEKVVQHSN